MSSSREGIRSCVMQEDASIQEERVREDGLEALVSVSEYTKL